MAGRKVTVERHDGAAADFYMAKQPWVRESACLGVRTNIFFDDIDCAREGAKTDAIKVAQEVCKFCPVRKECGEQAMFEEGDAGDDKRFGFRAYMTAEQRTSVNRRGGLKGRDPMRVVRGWAGSAPIPVEGDRWSRHHTTLARKTVVWLIENVPEGEQLPTQAKMCAALACQPGPLRRVMDALVSDGTVDFVGANRPGRGRNGANVKYVRRNTPRVVGSYLPPHLAATTDKEPPHHGD